MASAPVAATLDSLSVRPASCYQQLPAPHGISMTETLHCAAILRGRNLAVFTLSCFCAAACAASAACCAEAAAFLSQSIALLALQKLTFGSKTG